MAGAVLHDRHPVSAAEVLRIQSDRVGDAATINAQRDAVDVVEGVGLLVVVGIERLVGRPAPELGLLVRLLGLRPGEQPACRDTSQGEAVVVRATVERGVLRGLAGRLQIANQCAFDAGGAFRYHRLATGIQR